MEPLRKFFLIKCLFRTQVTIRELEPGDIFELFEPDGEFIGTYKCLTKFDEQAKYKGILVDVPPFGQ